MLALLPYLCTLGSLDLFSPPPVPSYNTLQTSGNPTNKESKAQAKAALSLAQKSTASVGKFDKKLKGEKKAPMKRKVEHMSGGAASEKSRSLELLGKIVSIDTATFDEAKAANKGLGSVSDIICIYIFT